MTALFRRKWRLTLNDFQSTEIDCKFKIARSLRAVPGTCELDIYNLTKDHRDQIHNLPRTAVVRVEAGYDNADGLSMLFQGNKRRADSRHEQIDWITTVRAGDGEHAIRSARAARSFGPNTTLQEVITYLAQQMGLGTGNVPQELADASLDQLGKTFPEGTSIRGLAARELGELLRSANLEWSVQEGVLQILPRGQALQRQAVLLKSDTGLLETPEKGTNHVVTAKALIIPDLVPGRLVQFESDIVNGVYRIERCEWTGDTIGGDWTVEITTRLRQ